MFVGQMLVQLIVQLFLVCFLLSVVLENIDDLAFQIIMDHCVDFFAILSLESLSLLEILEPEIQNLFHGCICEERIGLVLLIFLFIPYFDVVFQTL